MNQSDKELAENRGFRPSTVNGNAQLFGDKDLSLKSWLLERKSEHTATNGEALKWP